jgi:hypothetical protein
MIAGIRIDTSHHRSVTFLASGSDLDTLEESHVRRYQADADNGLGVELVRAPFTLLLLRTSKQVDFP